MYKFASASQTETIVFGSSRPGSSDKQVQEWVEFMQNQGIRRVCCLLSKSQLNSYSNLLEIYQQNFGSTQICWAPIEDFCLVDLEVLSQQILPFLVMADQNQQRVVVHCAGGVGRTGQILTAWLVAGRGFTHQEAIAAVKKTGRNPYEAIIAAPVQRRNPWRVAKELAMLWDECDRFRSKITCSTLRSNETNHKY